MTCRGPNVKCPVNFEPACRIIFLACIFAVTCRCSGQECDERLVIKEADDKICNCFDGDCFCDIWVEEESGGSWIQIQLYNDVGNPEGGRSYFFQDYHGCDYCDDNPGTDCICAGVHAGCTSMLDCSSYWKVTRGKLRILSTFDSYLKLKIENATARELIYDEETAEWVVRADSRTICIEDAEMSPNLTGDW